MGIPVLYQGSQYAPVPFVPIPPEPSGDPIGDALRTDAVFYYSGSRIDKKSGNDLTDHGSVGSVAGLAGDAMSFGTGKYLDGDNLAVFQISSVMTLALWVKLNSLPATGDTFSILSKDGDGAGDEWALICTTSSGYTFFDFIIQAGDANFPDADLPYGPYGDPGLITGVWYFAVCEVDQTQPALRFRLKPNPTPVFENLVVVPGSPVTADLFKIGFNGTYGNYCDGLMQNIGRWNRMLSSDERDYLYNSGAGRALFP